MLVGQISAVSPALLLSIVLDSYEHSICGSLLLHTLLMVCSATHVIARCDYNATSGADFARACALGSQLDYTDSRSRQKQATLTCNVQSSVECPSSVQWRLQL